MALVATLLLIMTLVTLIYIAPYGKKEVTTGSGNPEEAANRYVQALNNSDFKALQELAGGDHSRTNAGIEYQLEKYEGRKIQTFEVKISPGPVSRKSVIEITGKTNDENQDGGSFSERLYISKTDDRWYIQFYDPRTLSNSPTFPAAGTSRVTVPPTR